ncbi:hypothetical protein [uncultured Thiohalocapsa sp.]|nr:hypothetical protein [uncultured Thiohalocapsa sp.]
MTRCLIPGGSGAGISAALRARELAILAQPLIIAMLAAPLPIQVCFEV